MKYRDWLQQQQKQPKPSAILGNPIICPCCKMVIGYDKDYMFMVIREPIVCRHCDEIVIMPNVISFNQGEEIFNQGEIKQ